MEAFQVPILKKQVQKYRADAETNIKAIRSLEETLTQEKHHHAQEIEEQRSQYQNNITRLIDDHRQHIQERKYSVTLSEPQDCVSELFLKYSFFQ